MRLFGILITILLLASGCSRDAITVDGEGISREVFDFAVKERMNIHQSINRPIDEKALRKSVSDELIGEAILVREAKNRKITVTDEEVQQTVASMRGKASEQEFREDIKKKGLSYETLTKRVKSRLLISKLMNDTVKDDSITEAEMQDFYKSSQTPFLKPEKAFVKIMQVSSENDARDVHEKLRKGEDFDKLSDSLMQSGKAATTNYGWLDPNALPSPDLSLAMKGAKLNSAQGPYKAKDGSFYFFKVKEKQASQVMPFDEVKPQVKNLILGQKRQAAAMQIIETQRTKAKIKINVNLS